MNSGLRLRPCARPACHARRNQSSTGSCCDGYSVILLLFQELATNESYAEKCLNAIAQASMTQNADTKPGDDARSTPRSGIQRSLAQWKAALERAECLCTEMLNLGLPSCCTTQATELSSVSDQTMADTKNACSTVSLERTKKTAPESVTGDSQSCSSIMSSSKACCSSSPAAKTGCSPTPGPKTCCSNSPDAESIQCDVLAPTSNASFPSTPSIKSVQDQNAQHGSPSEGIELPSSYPSLVPAAIDLEKGSALEHAVTQISGMTCT